MPLHLDWILKQKKIVALGEGLKSTSDVGAPWDGSVHPSALRSVAHFTETMDCCGCDPCSCWVWHRLDQPGRRSQRQTQAMKGVSFAGGKAFTALKQGFWGLWFTCRCCHLESSHNSPMAIKISFTWWLDFADVSMNRRPLVLANSSPS